MLSILIPVYNYDVTPLVSELHKQAMEAKIEFEIICLDDGSNKYVFENKSALENLDYSTLISSKTNFGRTKSRQILSNNANYNWLLFLDADVIPKHTNFIKNYFNEILLDYEAIYGGITYNKTKPKPNYILRWKYGKTYEDVIAKKRNTQPYLNIVSANFLIKKKVFNQINKLINKKGYGLDNYFGVLLKKNKIKVQHINNEVYHLGIEKNMLYLQKIKQSVETLLWISNKNNLESKNRLLSYFILFRRLKLNFLIASFFKKFNQKIEKNLLGNNPNMFLLQTYKIAYMCFLDFEQKNKPS